MKQRIVHCFGMLVCVCLSAALSHSTHAEERKTAQNISLFDRGNLVAWCIVPFDSKKRGPEARAEMLARMGIFKFAYDWRAEHVSTFDEELDTLKRWNIDLRMFSATLAMHSGQFAN